MDYIEGVLFIMNKENPFLYFHFIHDPFANPPSPFYFKQPKKVIHTFQTNQVIPSLQRIHEYIQKGYYAAGYISYEAAPAFSTSRLVKENNQMPLLWFGIFDQPHFDLGDKNKRSEQTYRQTEWKANVSYEKYDKNFHKIKEEIKKGKTKQVNYTIRLESSFKGNSFAYFKDLKRTQGAHYNAYFKINDTAILSVSPELFFHIKNNNIKVKPMKGTIHRGKTYEEDLQNKKWLKNSYKNRHENEMITNMMRQELTNLARPESIQIKNKFSIEKYPTVYQMTSTLQAKLQKGKHFIDALQTLFPCGSITGTNKEETMRIIHATETNPREVYCGAIGYITPKQEAIFSVPIRTVIVHKKLQKAYFGVGGALTKHSNPKEEYKEILTKSKPLLNQHPEFQLLESFGLKNGKYIVYSNHLRRLQHSAEYFSFNIKIKKIDQELQKIARIYDKGFWKIRLLLYKDGKFSTEIEKINQPTTNKKRVTLAKKAIDQENIFLYHKTTYREIYDIHREDNFFDTLLWNRKKEVTEFTTGNIVVKLRGELITPPVSCGLLAGTYREKLLEDGCIKEGIITVEDLKKCTDLWLINSVREWIPVQLYP